MSQLKQRQAFPLLSQLITFAIALALIGAGYSSALGASAESKRVAPTNHISNFDFFTTEPKGTYFEFAGELALPAGFFDRDSARFEGRVPFKGAPIGTFQGHKVGNTDTVV